MHSMCTNQVNSDSGKHADIIARGKSLRKVEAFQLIFASTYQIQRLNNATCIMAVAYCLPSADIMGNKYSAPDEDIQFRQSFCVFGPKLL